MTIAHGKEFRELELNKKSLEETKRNLEKTIAGKSETIQRANQVCKNNFRINYNLSRIINQIKPSQRVLRQVRSRRLRGHSA
jgi:hypothetical protein